MAARGTRQPTTHRDRVHRHGRFHFVGTRNEAVALELLHEQEQIVLRGVQGNNGRQVKSTGDGALIEFPSVLKAAEFAIGPNDDFTIGTHSNVNGLSIFESAFT